MEVQHGGVGGSSSDRPPKWPVEGTAVLSRLWPLGVIGTRETVGVPGRHCCVALPGSLAAWLPPFCLEAPWAGWLGLVLLWCSAQTHPGLSGTCRGACPPHVHRAGSRSHSSLAATPRCVTAAAVGRRLGTWPDAA